MRYTGNECAFKLNGIARYRQNASLNFYITVRYVLAICVRSKYVVQKYEICYKGSVYTFMVEHT